MLFSSEKKITQKITRVEHSTVVYLVHLNTHVLPGISAKGPILPTQQLCSRGMPYYIQYTCAELFVVSWGQQEAPEMWPLRNSHTPLLSDHSRGKTAERRGDAERGNQAVQASTWHVATMVVDLPASDPKRTTWRGEDEIGRHLELPQRKRRAGGEISRGWPFNSQQKEAILMVNIYLSKFPCVLSL